jgi:predicted component of type VI protein secretion system
MPAQLISLDRGLRVLLDKPILLLGRDAECDIQFDSRKVSRRHCCIAEVDGRLIVRDLGSTNGVRINGMRVVEGYLKEGDELGIGNHRYRVSWKGLPEHGRAREKRGPAKEWAEPAASRSAEDEALEAADEPIPLSERSDVPPAHGRPRQPRRVAEGLPTQRQADSGPVLPDRLDLAPGSDVAPPPPSSPAAPG